MRVGVLALQGDVEEHEQAFKMAAEELELSIEIVRVKRPEQLNGLGAITIPGGESTAIGSLASRINILDPLRESIMKGLPVLGTCAGATFLAKEVRDFVVGETKQPLLDVMDVAVVRNAFGRQKESFEVDLSVEGLGELRAVFIRAPAIVRVWNRASSLAKLKHPVAGEVVVAAQEDNVMVTAFHPELTTTSAHRYLLELAKGRA